MKNLKRIFSLALAGTMLAGMMAVGASAADFSDASDIKNNEAVDTMVALDIIKGNDDGSFAPERTVSRAEMAKMITIMLNGGKEPALTATAENAKFTDIGGHWAQKYIEYCVSQNVIAGRGDGTFGPDATVTGTEAAKMALTALGYNSEVFHFTGADWAINVNAAANAPSANLYEGLRSIDPSAGLSRDNAAQMLYNALDAYVVELKYDYSSEGVTTNYAISDKKTMMSEKFGAVKVEGVVMANEVASIRETVTGSGESAVVTANNVPTKEGKTVIKSNAEDGAWTGTITVNTTTDLDLIGRTVSVYVKQSSKKTDATIVGNVVLSDSNAVYTSTDATALNEIEDGVATAGSTKYFDNYVSAESVTPAAGKTTILVDNDGDDTVDYVFQVTYTVAKVKKVNEKDKKMQFSGLTTQKFEDLFGYEDLEVDDIVLSTKIGPEGSEKYYLETPKTVEGEIEEYKLNDDADAATKLTVDGTTYDVAQVDISGITGLVAANTLINNVEDQGIFYLDANGMIVAYAETEASAAQYAISWGGASGNKIDSNRIKLTLEDGTTKVYTIDSKSDVKLSKEDSEGATFTGEGVTEQNKNAVGALVAYTIKSNGNVTLELPGVHSHKDTSSVSFEQGKTLVNDYASTSRTVFFFVKMDGTDVDSVEIYTGYKNAPSVDDFEADAAENKGVYLALDKNNDKVLAAAIVDGKLAADSAKLADHLWVKKLGTGNKNYTNVEVVLEDGTETTVKVDKDENPTITPKALYLYTIDSDGYYVLSAAKTDDASKDNYFEGTVYSVGDDTVILTVTHPADVEGKVEYSITADTVEFDDAKDSALEKGAKVTVLVGDKDDKDILMIVVTVKAAEE